MCVTRLQGVGGGDQTLRSPSLVGPNPVALLTGCADGSRLGVKRWRWRSPFRRVVGGQWRPMAILTPPGPPCTRTRPSCAHLLARRHRHHPTVAQLFSCPGRSSCPGRGVGCVGGAELSVWSEGGAGSQERCRELPATSSSESSCSASGGVKEAAMDWSATIAVWSCSRTGSIRGLGGRRRWSP
jgi:hypothetical protein